MKYILSLLGSLLICVLHAQPGMVIRDISTLGQLPVNAIHRIFQDSEGYMWYGTVDGLCRDDGYSVQVFRSDINTPGLLENNLVTCLAEDTHGNIWFGTGKGAYKLDKTDYRIHPLDVPRIGSSAIHGLEVTRDGSVWVMAAGELLRYQSDGTYLKTYFTLLEQPRRAIVGFCKGRNGEVWVTAGGILHYWDPDADVFHCYSPEFKGRNATFLMQDKEHDYYWFTTWGDGIVRFDPSLPGDSMYLPQPLPVNSQGEVNDAFFHLAQDDKLGYMWATSTHDLVAFAPGPNEILHQVDLGHLWTPSNRILFEVIKDRQGDLWVSAYDQPSFVVHFTEDSPKEYPLPALRNKLNSNPSILALADAGDGIMWISQERSGLYLYDLGTDRMSGYRDFPEVSNLRLDAVKSMTASLRKGGAWMIPSHDYAVYRLSRQGMEIKLADNCPLSGTVVSGSLQQVLEDSKGKKLWIGTSNGLFCYDLMQKTVFSLCDSIGFVTGMTETSQGHLWICTADKGLYRFSPDGMMQCYPVASKFTSVSATSDGTLWLGSEEGGVFSFDPSTAQFRDHSASCGMNGDQVNRIVTDVFNHVWIGMNQKVTEYNPRNGSFRTYLTTDGSLPLWRIAPGASCLGQEGTIFWGGVYGISSVRPSNRLESEANPVRTYLTNVTVRGESLFFGPKKGENSASCLRLSPEDRNLEIHFSSLNHLTAHTIRYAYHLKGIDKDWVYTQEGQNTAFYNYLPKGTYTFQVRATDENGLWSPVITELKIIRLPAFYETGWAYLFYSILLAGTLFYCIHSYLKRMKRKNEELWADSQEMIKMRNYLDSKVNLPEPEFIQLDKLFLEKAIKAVTDNLSAPDFDVPALAQAVHMSRSTLNRRLKAITGQTALDFIRNIKMKQARQMLQDRDRSVTEVASELGYYNRKYFTSCFKEEFGMTPSEYQKSLKADEDQSVS